jgi:hypothetical protein
LLPSYTGNGGKRLGLNSGATALEWVLDGGGTVTSVSGTGTVNGLTLTGTVTTSGSLTLGGTLDLSSPPTIGNTTRNTGAFTTLLVGLSGSANFTRFPNALSAISNTTAGIQQNETLYIGQIAESVSVGDTWASGLYGVGYTNSTGTGRGTGVTGEGHVSSAADTGVAVGVRGYAKDTHTGNYNIGLYGDAENGDTGLTYGGNVALFLANGNIVTSSSAAKTWYMGGNITFDGQGSAKTISATNGAVISISSGVTGTLPIANGGTGQTTANAAFNALAPSQTGNSGKYLTTDGSNTSWATNPLGTVTSVAATVPSFLSISGSPITTSGTLAFGLSGTALITTSGGTGLTSFTANGVVYASSTSALATGSAFTFDASTLKLVANNTSFRGQLTIEGGASDFSQITFYRGSTTNTDQVGYLHSSNSGSTGMVLGARNSAVIRFEVNDSERARIDTSGNFGIGTSSPASKLDVSTSGDAVLSITSAGVQRYQLITRTSGNFEIYDQSSSVAKAIITQAGNLGLGVSPSSQDATYRAINLSANTSNKYWSLAAHSSAACEGNTLWNAYSTGNETFAYTVTGDLASRFRQSGYFAWFTAPTGTAGNAISFTQAMTLTASNELLIGRTSSSGLGQIQSTIGADLATDSGSVYLVRGGGNVGIGTSSPTSKLHIENGNVLARNSTLATSFTAQSNQNTAYTAALTCNWDENILLLSAAGNKVLEVGGYTSANVLRLFTGNTERARIDSSGNFGIGTSSPDAKLQVIGQSLFGADGAYVAVGSPKVVFFGDAATETSSLWFQAGVGSALAGFKASDPTFYITNCYSGNALGTNGISITQNGLVNITTSTTVDSTVTVKATAANYASIINIEAQNDNGAIYNYIASNTTGVTQHWKIHGGATTNTLAFSTAGSERARITSSGDLLVGTTTLASGFSTYAQIEASGTTGGVVINSGASQIGRLIFTNGNTSGNEGLIRYDGSNNSMQFWTNASERARITSGGVFLIGTSSAYNTDSTTQISGNPPGNQVLSARHSGANPNGLYIIYSGASPNNTGNYFGLFVDSSTTRFELRSNGGIANYQANDANLSDRREKTNFAPAGSYLDKICAIPVQTFNYIDQNMEEDGGLTLGVVAQDVQAVAPELVMESNWAKKDEAPKMRLSIYQTDLQYALMKALQELKAEFDVYKASHP